MALCERIGTQAKQIDYRPMTHHSLYEKDSMFDFRFNAYERCKSYLTNLYESIIEQHHNALVEQLLDDVARNMSTSNIDPTKVSNSKRVATSIVTTGAYQKKNCFLFLFFLD